MEDVPHYSGSPTLRSPAGFAEPELGTDSFRHRRAVGEHDAIELSTNRVQGLR